MAGQRLRHQLAGGVREFFNVYESDDPSAPEFRARQLQVLMRLSPMAMAVSAFAGLFVAAMLQYRVSNEVTGTWLAAVLVTALLGCRSWLRTRKKPSPRTASVRGIRRARLHAGVIAAVWACLPAAFLPLLDEGEQLFVAMVTTGFMCAGSFALASIPTASTIFVALMLVGSATGLVRSDLDLGAELALMLVAFVLTILYAVWTFARMLGARFAAEVQADRQNEVIGLLLRDFEDQSSDILWEVDARGVFHRPSDRLVAALGVPRPLLERRPAHRLLDSQVPTRPELQDHWLSLREKLRECKPFRDTVIAVGLGEEQRWWSISARPLMDGAGEIKGWRGVASDVTMRQLTHSRLSWLANNDALTGLVNRNQFRQHLRTVLAATKDSEHSMGVVMIDLDGFKQVNDVRGHAAGDRLLQAFADCLTSSARDIDSVGRVGGDEFAVLIEAPQTRSGARAVAEDLFQALSTALDGLPEASGVRASLGVAIGPGDGADVDTLLNHADIALYAAKDAGGSRIVFFENEMAETERRRNALESSLRGAAGRGEFELVYQPKVSTEELRVVGFEALIRWTTPELGPVSPAEFIPVAEEAGLMTEIGGWVLRTACDEVRGWPADVSVSINVSAPQLSAAGFVDSVLAASEGIEPNQIELEITETALVGDTEAAVAILEELRSHGFSVALDDFGTGYSALGYLRRFAFDTLKIDRSFVQDLTQDPDALVIIETILAMSSTLGMTTVAEGVETQQEADMLRERGCEIYQGYLFSKPLARDAVFDFIAAWDIGREIFESVKRDSKPTPSGQ